MRLSKVKKQTSNALDENLAKIAAAKHHDPFEVLGHHTVGKEQRITVYMPFAESVSLAGLDAPFTRIEGTDFFQYIDKGYVDGQRE